MHLVPDGIAVYTVKQHARSSSAERVIERRRYVMAAETSDERDPFRWEGAAQTDTDLSGRKIGPKADSAWLNVCPDGFRKTLNWVSAR
jgi:hypothetical protein